MMFVPCLVENYTFIDFGKLLISIVVSSVNHFSFFLFPVFLERVVHFDSNSNEVLFFSCKGFRILI